jgi:hypothetical protein
MAKKRKRSKKRSFLAEHSLSIASLAVLALWIGLYRGADERTHLGSFFGNAIADWIGVVVMVLGTKHLYEKGSAESREPPHPLLAPVWETLRDHSLTIFLVITGIGWAVLFARVDALSKWGQVVGNTLSEWTQLLGLVWMTKVLFERHSKESEH